MTIQEARKIIEEEDEGARTDRYYQQMNEPSPYPIHTSAEIAEAYKLVAEDMARQAQQEATRMAALGFVEIDGFWKRVMPANPSEG
jgi:hypothetical protein